MFRDKWRESPTFEFLEKSLRHGSDSTGLTGSDSDSEYKISNSRSSFFPQIILFYQNTFHNDY